MPNKKEALFLIDSQPPHLGELISVLFKMKDYDRMNICVSGISIITPVAKVMTTWLFLLGAYKDKVSVCALLTPFAELSELPEQFKNCTVLTTSRRIFVHMGSLNIPVELVPRTLGYHGVFLRTAMRQGRALDFLESQVAHQLKNTPAREENLKVEDINEKSND